jgi:ribosomal protein S18 acetylase RimI-like enzyme
LEPLRWVLYILEADGDAAGMGALKRLDDETGEIKRMYIRPQYRVKGYGKKMLNRLLTDGGEMGCSTFRLDTPRWAHAAQHLYRSAGFREMEPYPESEVPPMLQPYWIWMERTSSNPTQA